MIFLLYFSLYVCERNIPKADNRTTSLFERIFLNIPYGKVFLSKNINLMLYFVQRAAILRVGSSTHMLVHGHKNMFSQYLPYTLFGHEPFYLV